MKKLSIYHNGRAFLLPLIFFLTGGCVQNMKDKEASSFYNKGEVVYLLSGKIDSMTEEVEDIKTLYTMKFKLKTPYVNEYSKAPFRVEKIAPLNSITKHTLPLEAVLSNPEKNEVVFAYIEKIQALSSSTLLIKYHINTGVCNVDFKNNYNYYNLRFLSIGEGADFIFLSKEGATLTKIGYNEYKLVIKGIFNKYSLSKKGNVKILTDELKNIVNAINSKHLNGDIALPSYPDKYIDFEIKELHFDDKQEMLTATIIPLNNKANQSFFNKIKKKKILQGSIDFHIDPLVPSKPRL